MGLFLLQNSGPAEITRRWLGNNDASQQWAWRIPILATKSKLDVS